VVALALAIPFTGAAILDGLFWVDRALGLGTRAVARLPSLILPINVAGAMAVIWAVARLGSPTLELARLDTLRRLAVVGLILYYVLRRGQTPALSIFALTELAAALIQGLASRRFARRTGA
jgi:hypothetical protein